MSITQSKLLLNLTRISQDDLSLIKHLSDNALGDRPC